ncbi:mechanosensitive ion channel, partial [Candidatus Gracilibacteria bacterium]|nr:mechanosensitive ion channel [Candidatus Gracilibacteria bacterium]
MVITIPNAAVLGSHVINYSAAASDSATPPLILHTTVTLGYDVPWRKVHEVLTKSALATAQILEEPAPFVLQTSLDDFYVSYELNAFTSSPSIMAKIYSELHQNIQDKCNEADIEILSPHYRAARDGNQTTIPADYLPPDYEA